MSKILRLPLKTKWFKMTQCGIKKEEYREITPYWISRLINWRNEPNWGMSDFVREFTYHGNELNFIENHGKKFDVNIMTLGYPKGNDIERILRLEHKGIEIREGKEEWGAKSGELYFVINHGEIIKPAKGRSEE